MRWRYPAALATAAAVAVLAVVGVAGASSGDALVLGGFNTADRSKTTLWANTGGPALRVKNVRPGQVALRLETEGAAPPLWVDSGVWVNRLNVDEVDGYDAADLTRAAWCALDNADDGTDVVCEMSLDAPVAGFVILGGSADLWRNVGGDDAVTCRFVLDGTPVVGSVREIVLNGDAYPDPSSEVDCFADAGATLTAGLHTVAFETDGVALGTGVVDVGAWVLFTPFGGDGLPLP
jgi:hypothetical protein